MQDLITKFQKLTFFHKMAILIGVISVIYCVYFFLPYAKKKEEIKKLVDQQTKLTQQINDLQAKVAQLPKLREELANLKAQLKLALKKLPNDQEIPELLQRISTVGRESGLEFNMFQPGKERAKGFYAEVPVSIKVSGSYHEVATFFERMGKLQRIINISDFDMGKPKELENKVVLDTSVTAMTFRFLQNAAPTAPEKSKKRKRRR